MEFLELRSRRVERFPKQSFDLHVDVLQLVFGYLQVKDRLSACLVSKKWFQVANQRRFLDDIAVLYQGGDQEAFVNLFQKVSRLFQCFVFRKCNITESIMLFLEKMQAQVVILSFDCCAFCYRPALHKLCNLQCLSLSFCSNFDPVFSKDAILRNLKTLHICRMKFSNAQFTELWDKTPHLQEFFCTVLNLYINSPELQSEVLMRGLKQKCDMLTCLSIRCLSIDLSAFHSFARLPLKLQKLCFAFSGVRYSNITVFNDCSLSLREFFTHQQDLVALELYGVHMEDDDLNVICHLPKLQELRLNCEMLSDVSLSLIFQTKQLKKLGLNCTFTDFKKTLKGSHPHMDLVSLILRRMKLTDQDDVQCLCDRFPNLKSLGLEGLSDTSVVPIFRLKNLQRLRLLCGDDMITEQALTKAVRGSRCHLLELTVHSLDLSDDFVDAICDRYGGLKVLNIWQSESMMTERCKEKLIKAGILRCKKLVVPSVNHFLSHFSLVMENF